MTSSAGQEQAQAAQGMFGFQGLMDDFYGYQPGEDDDEGRALKRGFQADMINKFANSQLAMGQAAQAQQYSVDSMTTEADLTLRNQTATNKQMFDYGMAEMGAKYDYESRMAVDDAARELNRMSTAGQIQQNQTALEGTQNRLSIDAQGRSAVSQIEAQSEGSKDLQRMAGQQALEQIDVSAAADVLKTGGTARQLQGDQLSSAERMQSDSLSSAEGMQTEALTSSEKKQTEALTSSEKKQTEALGAADVQQQRQLTSEENRQTEALAAADVQQVRGGEQAVAQIGAQGNVDIAKISRTGDENRATIGKQGTETRRTMREDEDIKMNQQNRATARSRTLARR